MLLKFGVYAALLFAAAPAFAQGEAAPAPPQAAPAGAQAAIEAAATAFGQCVAIGVQGLAPSVAPEAGAASVLGGCGDQRRQLEEAVGAMIATLPAEHQPHAREQLRAGLAEAENRIVAAIRQSREAAAAAPAGAQ